MPRIILDLNDDDEFRSCQVCRASLTLYHVNNAPAVCVPANANANADAALSKSSNCVKCGLFIELNPKQLSTSDCALIFVCSASQSHGHHLCWECGLLYELADKDNAEVQAVSAVNVSVDVSDCGSDHNASTSTSQSVTSPMESSAGKSLQWRKMEEQEQEQQQVQEEAEVSGKTVSK